MLVGGNPLQQFIYLGIRQGFAQTSKHISELAHGDEAIAVTVKHLERLNVLIE